MSTVADALTAGFSVARMTYFHNDPLGPTGKLPAV